MWCLCWNTAVPWEVEVEWWSPYYGPRYRVAVAGFPVVVEGGLGGSAMPHPLAAVSCEAQGTQFARSESPLTPPSLGLVTSAPVRSLPLWSLTSEPSSSVISPAETLWP